MVVELWSDRSERLNPGSTLEVLPGGAGATGAGAAGRTLTVESRRPHQDRWLVTFPDVGSREEAEALRGAVLGAPPLDDADDRDTLWVHDLVGAEVHDTSGRALGRVESVEANPASDLLVLSSGVLVPARFVVDHEPGVRVTVDIPDGLVELAPEH